ncbi:hypothetical protein WMF31_27910 [Sorangium sp. So ce1036]|uniref:hypothetical protein n=1 Tax=Sorangium sp. So ce1036 TaxID=3133328 RepID=UPI003EFCDC5D
MTWHLDALEIEALELDAPEKVVWLEIEGEGDEPRCVSCPRRAEAVDVRVCCACKRFTSLAIDPSGKHIYVVCEPSSDPPRDGA